MDKELIQEAQYDFPYHYLTSRKKGNFSLHEYLQWGLMHMSYMEFLVEKISNLPYNTLLDAGCGEGRLLYELEQKSPEKKFLGIDISERALHFARGFTTSSSFVVHDIIAKPTDEHFELCTSIEVIEHIPPEYIPAYVSNIANSLVTGGTLIITTPTDNYPVHRKHYQHFNQKKLEDILAPHFATKEVVFLNYENYASRLLARLLANKYFIINQSAIRNAVYRYYTHHYLRATANTGSRILIVGTKK